MNRLSTERRAQVVAALVEGNSIRATVHMSGVAKNTVVNLLGDLGRACAEYQDAALSNLPCRRIECDEIWSFCYARRKNVPEEHRGTLGYGDVWTWTAIDSYTKLVPSWLVGERTVHDAYVFLSDLKSRLRYRVQLISDGHRPYLTAVEAFLGDHADKRGQGVGAQPADVDAVDLHPLFGPDGIDFAMLHKLYGDDRAEGQRRYSPALCTGVDKRVIYRVPDERSISTSYVERQNLTMRMGMRRFTRLTNGFSKTVENLAHAVSLHYMHYNFCRVHQSLTATSEDGRRIKPTPAMAAGVADHAWSVYELVGLLKSD